MKHKQTSEYHQKLNELLAAPYLERLDKSQLQDVRHELIGHLKEGFPFYKLTVENITNQLFQYDGTGIKPFKNTQLHNKYQLVHQLMYGKPKSITTSLQTLTRKLQKQAGIKKRQRYSLPKTNPFAETFPEQIAQVQPFTHDWHQFAEKNAKYKHLDSVNITDLRRYHEKFKPLIDNKFGYAMLSKAVDIELAYKNDNVAFILSRTKRIPRLFSKTYRAFMRQTDKKELEKRNRSNKRKGVSIKEQQLGIDQLVAWELKTSKVKVQAALEESIFKVKEDIAKKTREVLSDEELMSRLKNIHADKFLWDTSIKASDFNFDDVFGVKFISFTYAPQDEIIAAIMEEADDNHIEVEDKGSAQDNKLKMQKAFFHATEIPISAHITSFLDFLIDEVSSSHNHNRYEASDNYKIKSFLKANREERSYHNQIQKHLFNFTIDDITE